MLVPGSCGSGDSRDADADDLRAKILDYASRLGPATHAALLDSGLAEVESACRAGSAVADAVLRFAHEHWSRRDEVAGEFLRSFRADLEPLGTALCDARYPQTDGEDLVESTFGDLWEDARPTFFTTRQAFLSFLATRLRWRASRHKDIMGAVRRGEGRTHEGAGPDDTPSPGRSPLSELVLRDELERATVSIFRLPPREREVLSRCLRGKRVPEIAAELAITQDAAAGILYRARERLRNRR